MRLLAFLLALFAASHADASLLKPRGSGGPTAPAVITNFDGLGTAIPNQVMTLDTTGNQIQDGQDSYLQCQAGMPSCPVGTWFRYTVDWSCGFVAEVAGSQWCGFLVFSSTDRVHWTNLGHLFSPTSWNSLCNGLSTAIQTCNGQRIIYNASTSTYLLWFLTYSPSTVGVGIVACTTPSSGCTNQAAPTLEGGANYPMDDMVPFVWTDGNPYILYSDHTLVMHIEELNSTYTSGNGTFSGVISPTDKEGLGFFTRLGVSYITYGTPCFWCNGTDTDYATTTATSNLTAATWTGGGAISTITCGGQPFTTSQETVGGSTVYFFNAAENRTASQTQGDHSTGFFNQGLANSFTQELTFTGSAINTLTCPTTVTLTGVTALPPPSPPSGTDQSNWNANFGDICDIVSGVSRLQVFKAGVSGHLNAVHTSLAQNCTAASCTGAGYPGTNAVTVTIAAWTGSAPGTILATASITASGLPWSLQDQDVTFGSPPSLTSGTQYAMEISANNSSSYGCVATAYDNANTYGAANGSEWVNTGGGWTQDSNGASGTRSMRFATIMGP